MADRPAVAVAQCDLHLVEQRHGHDIFGVGRRIGVKADGIEYVPRRHLARIVHTAQRQPFRPHTVEAVENVIQQLLRTLLATDEIIEVRETVVGLVAVAVLADEAREVVHFVSFPRNREEFVQLFAERLAAREEADQPLGVVRCEERLLPGIRLAVHIFIVGILVVEGRDPLAVFEAPAHQPRRGVEEVLIVRRALHQHVAVLLVAQRIGQEGDRIVVVAVLQRLGDGGLADRPRHGVLDVHFRNVPLGNILVEPRAARALYRSVAQHEVVGTVDVEAAVAAQVSPGHERRSVVAVEERGHEPAPFLALVRVGADDVGRHIGSQHPQQDQLIAVVVPIRRARIVTETGIDDLSVDIGELTVHVAAQRRPEERTVEARIEQPLFPLRAAFDADPPQQVVPRRRSLGAHLGEALAKHLGLEVLAGVLLAHEREPDPELQCPVTLAETHDAHLAVALDDGLYPGHGTVRHGVEIHLLAGLLPAGEHVITLLADIPRTHMLVRTLQVCQQGGRGTRGIGIFMECTAQRRAELCIDTVTVEEYLVIARGGRFALVAERRAVVARRGRPRHGQQGNMAKVPVPLVGVRKTVDHGIFILVARTAVELGDGADLHHGVGQRRSGENLGAPRPFGGFESKVDAVPQRRRPQHGVHIVGKRLLRRGAPHGKSEKSDTKSRFKHKRSDLRFRQN